jgi:hypothetical protein
MTALSEYLLSYGTAGEFGRFRPAAALECRRGDKAVVRSHRGVELATVLCPAVPGHARFLPNTTVGHLLRLAGPDDEAAAARAAATGRNLFDDARSLAAELGMPLEVVDAEVLLDGEHAILHHLNWDEFDERTLVATLTRRHRLHLRLHSLKGAAASKEHEEEHAGCGREGCGKTAGGSCATCGTGGGCSTCGVGKPQDLKAYFAGLREEMHRQRTPLL